MITNRAEERDFISRCRLEAFLKGYETSKRSYEGLKRTSTPGLSWDINKEQYVYNADDAIAYYEFNAD